MFNVRNLFDFEYIPQDLKPHIICFRISGMWPPVLTSHSYNLLSILCIIFIGIGFPFTELMNIFFVDSVSKIIDHCLISSTVVSGTVKGVNLYVQQSKLRKIFRLHKDMMARYANGAAEKEKFQNITKHNLEIHNFFLYSYLTGSAGVALQVLLSNPESRLFASTYLLPYAFASQPLVYLTVIFYQNFCSFLFSIYNAVLDTYPVILILILCGHMDILQNRLMSLKAHKPKKTGKQDTKMIDLDKEYYDELKECILYYESCLRCVDV